MVEAYLFTIFQCKPLQLSLICQKNTVTFDHCFSIERLIKQSAIFQAFEIHAKLCIQCNRPGIQIERTYKDIVLIKTEILSVKTGS